MNLYHLTQSVHQDYDTFDSCVVAAKSEQEAVKIHPGYSKKELEEHLDEGYSYYYNEWASPSEVTATLIGKAAPNLKAGEVICASYNAG